MSDQRKQAQIIKDPTDDTHRQARGAEDQVVQEEQPAPAGGSSAGSSTDLDAKQRPPGGDPADQDQPGVPPSERADR